MIYLIDDKISRQKDYGWSSEKLGLYSRVLKPIYTFNEILDEDLSKHIFSEDSIVLFHESFFDSVINVNNSKDLIIIREKIDQLTSKKNNFKAAFFSGSKSSRNVSTTKKTAHLPVSILYQNLEVFINKIENNKSDFRYLLFGENYKIEEELLDKLLLSNNDIDELEFTPNSSNFIAQTEINEIEEVFSNAHYKTFYSNDENLVTDSYLNFKIEEWFKNKEFDNIFIPLCFGATLSDFNGLRLAMHIRCSDIPSKLKNIFIYSFIEDITLLMGNEYFDILKTKNVQLIDYKKLAFKEALEKNMSDLLKEEFSSEIRKIHLKIPRNFYDSHSVANIWGMYRLLEMEGISPKKINSLANDEFLNNIYIKLLLIKNPIKEKVIKESKKDTKRFSSKLKGLKILGNIDLSKLKK